MASPPGSGKGPPQLPGIPPEGKAAPRPAAHKPPPNISAITSPAMPALRPPPPPPGGVASPPAIAPVVPSIAPIVPSAAPQLPPRAAAPTTRAAPPATPDSQLPASGPLRELNPAQFEQLVQRCAQLNSQDYFEVLNLAKNASSAEIKTAFYRESRGYHPDRFFHLDHPAAKGLVNEIYKRVTEAYYVLRDDAKRRQYLADVSGPDRAQKLRFSELAEAESRHASAREQQEQIGSHPKGRQFYQAGMQDIEAQRWQPAERNLKMALTYEPANPRYREQLVMVQAKIHAEQKEQGGQFKIR